MSGVVIKTNPKLAPERVAAAFTRAAEKQMRLATLLIEGEIRRLAPSRTGHLRRSITSTVTRRGTTITATIGTNLPYAVYVEQGTGLYGPEHRKIVPVHARALRWPAGGSPGRAAPGFTLSGRVRSGRAGAQAQWIYRASTRGMRGRHFFAAGAERGRGIWEREIGLIGKVARTELGLVT